MNDRRYWLETMLSIGKPVLQALAEGRLKQEMPVRGRKDDRVHYSHLEAFGRTLSGMAPWLESGSSAGQEGIWRRRYGEWARLAMKAATDPESPDYLNFEEGGQPLVDAAFLAHAILRAPTELWEKLDPTVQQHVIRALKSTRRVIPPLNNWLLFCAMIETVLYRITSGTDWDPVRVDYALQQHRQWYKGDGMFGDGPEFHWDYYNSFVIQPMLLDILDTVGDRDERWERMKEPALAIAKRYAVIQERLIAPDGSYPPIGRSLAYRFGAFQHLSHMALRRQLPDELEPAQVRCALTAVIRRTMEAKDTFDEQGWLNIGLYGHQPGLGEAYISTGSLYLCTAVFLPLGLPEDDAFWQGQAEWTSLKVWSGKHVEADHAVYIRPGFVTG